MRKYVIDHGCKLCEACIWACPKKAIYSDGEHAHIDQGKCIHCGACYQSCPNEAISVQELPASGENTTQGEKI